MRIKLTYLPLLQSPPLHLAILIAKDSPLLIDCPASKYGGVSSAHSNLDAAIAKFRMSAYMWQALTAEDLRSKGLGRRAFRLDEQWGLDTLSKDFLSAKYESSYGNAMQATAKVNLIRTEMTVAELRDAQRAQQNPHGRQKDELHDIFSKALKAHGGVFESGTHPIVAGLILDSHFSMQQDLVLAHAALGAHDPNGLSLGVMGSHLTYAWPRFMEEVADCLLDTKYPGDTVCNDNGECLTMWEACSVGQGAFLHEVGHAFSAPHTTGIMARGYSPHWPKCFLAQTAYSAYRKTEGLAPVTKDTANECNWDIRDAMRFVNLPHFWLPSDPVRSPAFTTAVNRTELLDEEDDLIRIKITNESGIAQAWLNGKLESSVSLSHPREYLQYTLAELEGRFDRKKALELETIAMNGKEAAYNLWKLFSQSSIIRVPGTSIRLQKQTVGHAAPGSDSKDAWTWAVMLKKRGTDGALIPANKIDLRVGCSLDGAVVYYEDNSQIPCGPRNQGGMGGHLAEKLALPSTAEITKVEVVHYASGTPSFGTTLHGLRMHLSTGKARGALNANDGSTITALEPPPNHKIIGFHGRSGKWGMCMVFGIITAPKDAELPDSMYDLPELSNTDGGLGGNNNEASEDEDIDYDEDDEMSEDED